MSESNKHKKIKNSPANEGRPGRVGVEENRIDGVLGHFMTEQTILLERRIGLKTKCRFDGPRKERCCSDNIRSSILSGAKSESVVVSSQ